MTPPKQTVDKTPFRINLTILAALVIALATGTAYATKLVGVVESMDTRLGTMSQAVDRVAALVASDAKALAVLQTRCDGLAARVRLLEEKTK